MKIDQWAIETVKPYPGNPRINEGAVNAVATSIREFGFRQPIVVDADVGEAKYERMKQTAAARVRALSAAGREIGAHDPPRNPERRASAAESFRFFCDAYFPLVFTLKWSEDHLRVMGKIEQCVLRGGLVAVAMPRGSGKTSLTETACIWAILYGHRDFVALIGATERHAAEMLGSIKMELLENDLLHEDFPEVTHPIRSMDGIVNRCRGQTFRGQPTHITWAADAIVLPTVAGSQASGAILKAAGISGRIRGMKHKRADGKATRPSLAILDDPQTDESAQSFSQCETRERLIAGAVLGLAGPGKKIAAIMPCTVIRHGDMADRLLDRALHPEWNGERTKMVYQFPKNEKLWEEYGKIRAESLRKHEDLRDATAFYVANREAMDEGAVVAWPDRYNHDEVSALQNAMNLRFRDAAAFAAEYQGEPMSSSKTSDDGGSPSCDDIAKRVNGLARGAPPIGATRITAFIDVHARLLYWMALAASEDFSCAVIDYGAYPDPKRVYFAMRDARKSLQDVAGAGVEGAIYAGLDAVVNSICEREWKRADGAALRVERCLIDANWGPTTNVIYQFCQQSRHAGLVMPSHGRYVGATSRPFSEYTRRPGDQVGLAWRVPNVRGARAVRHVAFDSNFWKSFLHSRLSTAMGDAGSFSFFGREPASHRMLAEHLASEKRTRAESRGRVVDEWRLIGGADNHLLDCAVGCCVAASMMGATLPGTGEKPRVVQMRRKPICLSDLQTRRQI